MKSNEEIEDMKNSEEGEACIDILQRYGISQDITVCLGRANNLIILTCSVIHTVRSC